MKTEIEIKIELDEDEFKKLAGSEQDFILERTYGYFREDFSNIKEGIFPRIKYIKGRKKEIILTVKLKQNENKRFFEREEIETRVNGTKKLDQFRLIFKALGFSKEIIFEKKRKDIKVDGVKISFDILPFGYFVEFEGEPEKIDDYLEKNEFGTRKRITEAYLKLWEDYKKVHGIQKENCVFK